MFARIGRDKNNSLEAEIYIPGKIIPALMMALINDKPILTPYHFQQICCCVADK